jgi:hypothetical protein
VAADEVVAGGVEVADDPQAATMATRAAMPVIVTSFFMDSP